MKRTLLIASIIASGSAVAQFTQANEPALGTSQSFYLIDTLAPNYAGVTGTGVTWDYSSYGVVLDGTSPATTMMEIVTPASTPNGSNYPSATKAVQIDGYMTSYFTSTATSRNSKGFVFDGTNSVVLDDANDELLMNYPFAMGANLSDNFTGDVITDFTGTPTTFSCTGTNTAAVDGSGTLILNGTTILTGILRYKLVDQATATIPFIGTATMARTQYEYYNLTASNLPVFVHSKVDITIGGGEPTSQVVVMSSVLPDGTLSIDNKELKGVTVYPNPATDQIKIGGLKDNADITLMDAQGKTVHTVSVSAGTSTLNISAFEQGIYFLNIKTVNGTKVERVVIR